MININITTTSDPCHQNNKAYYEMTTTDKRSLISESVMVIQIGVQSVGEEHDQHVVHVASRVSCMTTIRKVPTKSKRGPSSWDEVLAPSDRPARSSS
jgi:hypothetical protein